LFNNFPPCPGVEGPGVEGQGVEGPGFGFFELDWDPEGAPIS